MNRHQENERKTWLWCTTRQAHVSAAFWDVTLEFFFLIQFATSIFSVAYKCVLSVCLIGGRKCKQNKIDNWNYSFSGAFSAIAGKNWWWFPRKATKISHVRMLRMSNNNNDNNKNNKNNDKWVLIEFLSYKRSQPDRQTRGINTIIWRSSNNWLIRDV